MIDTQKDIDIKEILDIVWRNKIIIIVLAVIAAVSVFVKTYYFTNDRFQASCVLYVSNKDKEATNEIIEKSDIDTSRSLSATYIELLKTDSFLESVCDDLPKKISWEDLSKMLSISVINDTELIDITVESDSKLTVYNAAVGIMNKAPEMLANIFEGGEVKVVNPPRFPHKPISKGIAKKTAVGFFFGAFLGCAYAFIKMVLDQKVHKGEDIANRYNISVLGETAQPTSHSKRNKRGKKSDTDLASGIQNILSEKTDFDTVETYKSIRTNIMFSTPKQDKGKVIAVTSASPGEGKTTTAINLAITFSQTGAKIILIDCDLRRARVHRYLQLERKEGVSNVVCGYTELPKAIIKSVRENLDVLTAGENPPNPAELLQTQEFQNMIAQLQKEYDYIFIDTPPITIVTDAAILSKQCDGIVVVAKSEVTTYDLLDVAIKEIRNTKARIIGTIVHDSSEKLKKYGYYKSKKYGYKYKYE